MVGDETAAVSLDGRARPETRRRILDAAIGVFAEKGYRRTAVEDIVRASDTSKGSFYHFFPGKEGIFVARVDQRGELLLGRVAGDVETAAEGLDRVGTALRAALDTFGSHRRLARILLVEAPGLGHGIDERLFALHGRFARYIAGHLKAAVADGSIRPVDCELVAHAWIGAINEVVLRWLYTGRPEPLVSAVPELRSLFLRSVGAEDRG